MADPVSIGGYAVVRRLGAGGMGEVYLVQHPRLPRQDALKLLSGSIGTDEEAKARFLREADVLATLSHPNIVHLYDRGEDDGRLWLTMEYVEGSDAAQLLRERGAMPADLAFRVIDGVGSALDYGHRVRGVTHRDVKPANILIGLENGAPASVKLTDFGIAKAVEGMGLTATGLTMGTMAYLAPEAIEGRPVDHRADQYSLACTAFELLTGTPPYPRESARAVTAAHLSAPPPRLSERAPHLGTAADGVFARALAKEPDQRFATNAEFTGALGATLNFAPPQAPAPAPAPAPFAASGPTLQAGLPTQLTPATPAPPAAPPKKSRRGLLIGGAVATTILVGAGVAFAVTRGGGDIPFFGDEDKQAVPTVTCDFADRPDAAETLRANISQARKQVDGWKAQLKTTPADQQKAVQERIDAYNKQIPEAEKLLPALEKLADRNKTVSKPGGTGVPKAGTLPGTMSTNFGAINFTLDRSKAPCNVQTVETLIKGKYFDDTTCHREVNQPSTTGGGLYVLQCGDPSATGQGGPSWSSPDEKPDFLKTVTDANSMGGGQTATYPAGTIAVANANRDANPMTGAEAVNNTGSSQFFLVYKDTVLPPNYAVIGTVDDAGIKVLQQIAAKGIVPGPGAEPAKPNVPTEDGQPKETVTITTMALK